MFTEKENQLIRQKGITHDQLNWQIGIFQKGVPFMKLDRAATINDGILKLSEDEISEFINIYENATDIDKIKFVPASGAASRMFKALYEYIESAEKVSSEMPEFIGTFFTNIRLFAFYDLLNEEAEKSGSSLENLLADNNYIEVLRLLLDEKGLNYGDSPKGLLDFHNYDDGPRKPFEEHLVEGMKYAISKGNKACLHFTVSPEHKRRFESLLGSLKEKVENRFGCSLQVDFSVQKASTDTMAVDLNNNPFRDEDGSLLFRPGGHGALIENLDELNVQIIFIKNIDNVVPEKYLDVTVKYKKALAGVLIDVQKHIYAMLEEIDEKPLSKERAGEMLEFIRKKLCYEPQDIPATDSESVNKEFLRFILNRPVRVCGMVKNEGEPGGGPYWAPNSSGDITLQVVESSQVDHANIEQEEIFRKATHFNPVDLVCSPVNYKGEKFDLKKYVDKNTCFISQKSKGGKELKALELPGLWNGAMADWITIFVEVPVETFNPVKTVNDLLRKYHQ
ncbi:MAG: DUF4301 family protein [Bacteroidales bacterium]|nr:DUF4301 family protein [Bacteroidales bacterium]